MSTTNDVKVYGIADVHFLTKKFDQRVFDRFKNFIENVVEENSIVCIAGDLFNIPIPNSNKAFHLVNEILNVMNSNTKNIHFFISSGNHDLYNGCENIGIFSTIVESSHLKREYDDTLDNLPKVVIANELTTITTAGYHFTLMPYGYDDFVSSAPKDLTSFLICHGSLESDFMGGDIDESLIPNKLTMKFDHILKGHIHKQYKSDNIYSPGAFMNITSTDQTGYFLYNNGKAKLESFKDNLDVIYCSGVCDEKNINEYLEKYGEGYIVNILYKGNPDVIDHDLFNHCYNSCIEFHVIFENKISNIIRDTDGNSEDFFENLDFYLEKNMDPDLYKYYQDSFSKGES